MDVRAEADVNRKEIFDIEITDLHKFCVGQRNRVTAYELTAEDNRKISYSLAVLQR